jgi:hypothetical protein
MSDSPQDLGVEVESLALGVSLGSLPPETVDAMFASMTWQAEREHGLSARAAILAIFASAKVEADIMSDADVPPRDRLKAAQQFKEGFIGAARIVGGAPRGGGSSSGRKASIPSALEEMYGDGN